MDTVLLQIKNDKVYKLIQDLEALGIVKILEKNARPIESLHKKFKGSLNLTHEQYKEFQQSLIDNKGNNNNA